MMTNSEVTAAEFVREFRRRTSEESARETAEMGHLIERLEVAESDPHMLSEGEEGVDARSPDSHDWLTEHWLKRVAFELGVNQVNLIPESGSIWRMTW